jgi:hypothetical protein
MLGKIGAGLSQTFVMLTVLAIFGVWPSGPELKGVQCQLQNNSIVRMLRATATRTLFYRCVKAILVPIVAQLRGSTTIVAGKMHRLLPNQGRAATTARKVASLQTPKPAESQGHISDRWCTKKRRNLGRPLN